MISLSWRSDFEPNLYDDDTQIRGLMARYHELPIYLAKKYMKASLAKAIKHGVPILRRNTPPLGTRRGRRKKGEKAKSTGALRRSVTTRSGQTGRNTDFNMFVWAVLGYRKGEQSRKAIWLEYGTSGGVRPFAMMEKTMREMGPIAASAIAKNMAEGLDKAAKEMPTYLAKRRTPR